MTRFRVTYLANPGEGKPVVELSEIDSWDDIETAYHESVAWAGRLGWLLKRVEELEVRRT